MRIKEATGQGQREQNYIKKITQAIQETDDMTAEIRQRSNGLQDLFHYRFFYSCTVSFNVKLKKKKNHHEKQNKRQQNNTSIGKEIKKKKLKRKNIRSQHNERIKQLHEGTSFYKTIMMREDEENEHTHKHTYLIPLPRRYVLKEGQLK